MHHPQWHTSTYSTGGSANCVEVAEGPQVLIRDTQHRHLGHLTVPAKEWRAFLAALQTDQL